MNGRMAKRCRRAAVSGADVGSVLRSYKGTHHYSPGSTAWRYRRIKRAVTRHLIPPFKQDLSYLKVTAISDKAFRDGLLNPSKPF